MLRGSRTAVQWSLAIVAACALAIGAAGHARAEPGGGDVRLAALERAFWACDYIGTKEGVAEAPVQLCVEVTRDLQHERFGGDFDAMVKWWQLNKAAEHARLAAGIRAGAREVTDSRRGA
jgi:hypothetical protein